MNVNMIVDSIITNLSNNFYAQDLQIICNEMVSELGKYYITIEQNAIVPYDTRYENWMKMYIATKSIDGLSKGSCKQYMPRITDFIAHLNKPIEEYTDMDFQMYLYEYRKRKNVSNRTLNTIRGEIASWFKQLLAKSYISKDPTITVATIKYQPKKREPLTDDELVALKHVCDTPREKLLISLLFETGCRVSEVVNIKINDIDMIRKSIVVTGKGNKTRTVYFQSNTKWCIEHYLKWRGEDCSEYLFVLEGKHKVQNKPISVHAVEDSVRELRIASKIKNHCIPHTLRHTFATDLLQSGMDVTKIQKLMGHSSISTTMVYADVNMNDVEIDYRKHM